jgi:Tfp pilus assembly protein PilF
LASYYQNAKNFPDAIDEYARVVALRPNDAAALNNLAWLYQQQALQSRRSCNRS